MRCITAAHLLPLVLACAAPAQAGTAWLCNLSSDAVRLVCVADNDPRDDVTAGVPVATVRGQSFPLDPRRAWTVDLWSPPSDPADLELLARATICYRSAGCTVTLAPIVWSVASMPRPRSVRTP